MRTALLFALADPAGPGAGRSTAFSRFAGKSVLLRQIDCAAHLGCRRVLRLRTSAAAELTNAESYADRLGMRFDWVGRVPDLIAQVSADDEIFVLAEGVLPDVAGLKAALSEQSGVAAFPAQLAVGQGYERIDADWAWSGALRARGDCVARLSDMPTDIDVASSTLRIALQRGTRIVALDRSLLIDRTWLRRVDPDPDDDAEKDWIKRQLRMTSFAAPATALVEHAGLRLAWDAGGGRWARLPHAATIVALAIALLAALFERPTAGLASLLLASAALVIAGMFDRLETLGAPPRQASIVLSIAAALRDGLLIVLLAKLVITVPGWLGTVLPLAFIGVLRLGETTAPGSLRSLMSDRILLLSALVTLAHLGWTTIAVATLLIVSLAGLLWPRRTRELTAD